MSHTPGPWQVDFVDGVDGVYAAADKRICQVNEVDIVGWNARFRDESEANAKLIAAAPELLEALQLYLTEDEIARGHGYGIGGEAAHKAIAAITKATA